MDINKNFHFFWKGILSNWAKSEFIIAGIKFNCGEQYMMWFKAMMMNDWDSVDKIMNEFDPKIIKKLGREIKNFNETKWNSKKYNGILFGLTERANQDITFRNELLKHKGKIFVEASPYDRIWGIGYSEKNALENINNWGENLLGKILTEIANNLK